MHENLEPDATPEPLTSLSPETLEESSPTATVDAGDAAVPATPSGASDVPSRKETVDAGDAAVPSASAVLPGTIDSPADPQTAKELLGKPDNSPLLPEAAQVPDAGPSGEQAAPGSNLGAVDLPPAQDPTQQSKPANVAKLADNGAISEAREEPVAKPSPALDLAGEAVPAAASPPTSQPADSLQAGANPLVGDTLLGDTPDLTKPAVPQPEPEALASSPSPTAVAEEEVRPPVAISIVRMSGACDACKRMRWVQCLHDSCSDRCWGLGLTVIMVMPAGRCAHCSARCAAQPASSGREGVCAKQQQQWSACFQRVRRQGQRIAGAGAPTQQWGRCVLHAIMRLAAGST